MGQRSAGRGACGAGTAPGLLRLAGGAEESAGGGLRGRRRPAGGSHALHCGSAALHPLPPQGGRSLGPPELVPGVSTLGFVPRFSPVNI